MRRETEFGVGWAKMGTLQGYVGTRMDLFKISKNGLETQRLDDAAGEKWKLRWCAKEMNFSCEHNDVGSVKESLL